MPYDRHSGLITVDETTTPHRGVEIADIQSAVPATIKRVVSGVVEAKSSSDLGVLAGARVGSPVTDNAGGTAWVVSSRVEVNTMAKYKPVRFNKLSALTEAEFRSVRYGLRPHAEISVGDDSYISTFNSSDPNPVVNWQYDKPRGLLKSSSPSDQHTDEPYRDTDFKNYFHRASPPFVFTVSGELGNSVGVTFYRDQLAWSKYNEMAGSTDSWHPEYNLKIEDLFNGYTQPSDSAHFCVCIHNITRGGYCAVISRLTLEDIVSTCQTMIMYANETSSQYSGETYPAVPMLGAVNSGDTFRFIVGLVQNGPGSQDPPYQVTTDSIYVYPLAFRDGIDRKDIQLYSHETIQGLTCRFMSSPISATFIEKVSYTPPGSTVARQMDKYIVSGTLNMFFITPSDRWAVDQFGVKLNMRTQGYVDPIETSHGITNVGSPNTEYVRSIVFGPNTSNQVFLYIEPAADSRTLEIIGRAEYAYEQGDRAVDFESSLIVSIPKPPSNS